MAPWPGTFPRGDTDRTTSRDLPEEERLWTRGERGKHLGRENRSTPGEERNAPRQADPTACAPDSTPLSLRCAGPPSAKILEPKTSRTPLAYLTTFIGGGAWLGGVALIMAR